MVDDSEKDLLFKMPGFSLLNERNRQNDEARVLAHEAQI
jgi:hypothetical protein